ncbi:phage minor capsid protein [Anaerotignum sp.]|uniref:phage minor capsid protein n=1 Tax=Anaerotignum sp. TaxID=2039241 RepID=UPI00331F7C5E
MLSEEELNLLADIFAERFGNVNARILLDMAETLKKTEDLIPTYSKKLQQMYAFGYDVDLITQQLARESGKSIEEVEKLYEVVAQEGLDWTKPFYEAKGIKQIPLSENKVLQNIIQSAAAVTKDTLRNISNTTTVGIRTGKGFEPLGSFYKKTVDQAITAAAAGTEDYKKVIRQAVKDMGNSGLRVRYESGYTKRLDSAIRQNILDGVSYIAQETAHATGKEFGADGVEISAHSPCAPDHIPYQGNQYSNKEFQELQQRLTRPIGEWNCRHIAYPILLGVSHPANSKAELKEMKRYSNEKIMIDGNEYTRYECTQLQRKMETKLRYAREEKQLYQAIEDKDLVRGATEKIRLLSNKYVEVSEKAGLPTKAERTRIVSSKMKEKRVVHDKKDAIIKLAKAHKIKGEVSLDYSITDTTDFKFDDAHINVGRIHGVTKDEAQRFIAESKVMLTRWKGQFQCFFGSEGATYIDLKNKNIRTSFKREEYDPETLSFIEGIEKIL